MRGGRARRAQAMCPGGRKRSPHGWTCYGETLCIKPHGSQRQWRWILHCPSLHLDLGTGKHTHIAGKARLSSAFLVGFYGTRAFVGVRRRPQISNPEGLCSAEASAVVGSKVGSGQRPCCTQVSHTERRPYDVEGAQQRPALLAHGRHVPPRRRTACPALDLLCAHLSPPRQRPAVSARRLPSLVLPLRRCRVLGVSSRTVGGRATLRQEAV
jgi:hypothetical protein